MTDQAKSKDRSPNYPALSLEAAVGAVHKLYKADGTAPVPMETLAEFAGHKKMSGPARSKLAAIRQYGLIDGAGAGKVKVSERALPLFFHQPNEREYQQTLRDLALTPPLFGQLFSQYTQASENTLRLHLVRDRDFSEEGAKRLARIFKDNIAFARLTSSSYNEHSAEDEEEQPEEREEPTVAVPPRVVPQRTVTTVARSMPEDTPNFPLPDGLAAKVFLNGPPTKRALLRLAQRIKEWAEDLPLPDPRSPEERARIADLEAGAAY